VIRDAVQHQVLLVGKYRKRVVLETSAVAAMSVTET
jgi:hypothetical protein